MAKPTLKATKGAEKIGDDEDDDLEGEDENVPAYKAKFNDDDFM